MLAASNMRKSIPFVNLPWKLSICMAIQALIVASRHYIPFEKQYQSLIKVETQKQ